MGLRLSVSLLSLPGLELTVISPCFIVAGRMWDSDMSF